MIEGVKVIKGCISCRTCEDVCPSVFKVAPTSQVITQSYEGKETEILQAEALCPVQVIKVDKKGGVKLAFKSITLLKKEYLTDDIIELTFESSSFNYKAGQYISLLMKDWKGKISRNYSLAEVTPTNFTLNIRLLEKGRGSEILKKMKTGESLEFLGPLGSFVLQHTPKTKYFISTGTGLAPFISMAERTPAEVKKVFVIGARKVKDLYYIDRIKKYPNTEIKIYISQEESEYNTGRVTDEIKNIPQDSEVYICGNPQMLHSVKTELEGANHPVENIFHEAFTVSGKYVPLHIEIFKNGNIPFLKEIGGVFALLGLMVFPLLNIYYNTMGNSPYDSFLVFQSFQGFWWSIAWWSVVFVMMIRPLSDIVSGSKFLRKLKTLRKPLGILSASVIVFTLLGNMVFNDNAFTNYFLANRWNSWSSFPARAAEVTALILLLTSNIFSQRLLGKGWKAIQSLSYVFFICGGIVQASFGDALVTYSCIGIWGVLWVVSLVKNIIGMKK